VGIVGRVVVLCVEDLWFNPWSGQVKVWKIDSCCFQ